MAYNSTAPNGAPAVSASIASTLRTVNRPLPSPTVRLLTCVDYMVDPKLPAIKNLLGLAALHIGDDALLSLSQERLAYICGRDIQWVRRTLRQAEQRGYIQRLNGGRGRGKTTHYRVLLMASYAEAADRKRVWPEDPKAITVIPFPVDKSPQKGIILTPKAITVTPDPNRSEFRSSCPMIENPIRGYEETKRYLRQRDAEA